MECARGVKVSKCRDPRIVNELLGWHMCINARGVPCAYDTSPEKKLMCTVEHILSVTFFYRSLLSRSIAKLMCTQGSVWLKTSAHRFHRNL
jgi:hypothetical protein